MLSELETPESKTSDDTKRRRGRPKRVYDEAKMVSLYQQGYSIGTLAKHFGVAVSTLMVGLKAAEVKCRGAGYRQPKELPELPSAKSATKPEFDA